LGIVLNDIEEVSKPTEVEKKKKKNPPRRPSTLQSIPEYSNHSSHDRKESSRSKKSSWIEEREREKERKTSLTTPPTPIEAWYAIKGIGGARKETWTGEWRKKEQRISNSNHPTPTTLSSERRRSTKEKS
jgi:hypothetical protein